MWHSGVSRIRPGAGTMMRVRKSFTLPLGALLLGLTLPTRCLAQRVLYDSTRDQQAKAAATAAGDVASDSLFETLSKNVEEAGKQQLEVIMRWQEVRLRAGLNGLSTWG